MTSCVFYLILIIGSPGAVTSQSSTPIGSVEACEAAGKQAEIQMPNRTISFVCVEGAL